MVSISKETVAQTDARLRALMPKVALKVYDGAYRWEDFPRSALSDRQSPHALALVSDDFTWSQLVPAADGDGELFRVFRFHFPHGLDNSGFVGWLASLLKSKFGTGVFVICGFNGSAGGIYDYWGCPLEVADAVLAEIDRLTTKPAAWRTANS